MNPPEAAPYQPPAEQLTQDAIAFDVWEQQLRTGPNVAYMDTEHGQVPLAVGQVLRTWVSYDDGKPAIEPINRFVGADHRIHDLTRDEHGTLPQVVTDRLARLAAEMPGLNTEMPSQPKVMIKGGDANSFFDPSLSALKSLEVREPRIPLLKKVTLGLAELIRNKLRPSTQTGRHHRPAHGVRPSFA